MKLKSHLCGTRGLCCSHRFVADEVVVCKDLHRRRSLKAPEGEQQPVLIPRCPPLCDNRKSGRNGRADRLVSTRLDGRVLLLPQMSFEY